MTRTVIASIAVVVGGLLVVGPGAPHADSARARNGLIFFDRTRATGGDIYSIHPGRSGFRHVVRNGLQPSASPDGRLVVFQGESARGFVGGYNLAVVRPNGSGRRVIPTQSETPESPSFSPDSTEIVFDDGARSIWAVDTDGSNLRRLVSLQKLQPMAPVFSPDGRAILFTELNRRTGHSAGFFMMDPDGTHVKPVPHLRRTGGSFSPDGRTVVFSRHASLYRMSSGGSHLRRLTHPPTTGLGGGPPPSDDQALFSPDGKEILFIRSAGSLPGGRWSGPHGVYVMNADGSHLRRLKDGAWFDPAWQSLP